MTWNIENTIRSTDSQFNDGPDDAQGKDPEEILKEYDSAYQVAVSPKMNKLLGPGPKHRSLNSPTVANLRYNDEKIIGKPVEFYRSILAKPEYRINYRGRDEEFQNIIRHSTAKINSIYNNTFEEVQNKNFNIYKTIEYHTEKQFSFLDKEMLGIITGYLKQMPKHQVIFLDDEVVDEKNKKNIINNPLKYFTWLEGVRFETVERLRHYNLKFLEMVTGKGYHFLTKAPLHSDNQQGGIDKGMLKLMAIGGTIQPETIDTLVTNRPDSKRPAPTSILSQRAYQGAMKLAKFIQVTTTPAIKNNLKKNGHCDNVNYSDTDDLVISLDLTSILRQIDMAVFGSAGSVYNKVWSPDIIRIPRSNSLTNNDYFKGNVKWMLETRNNKDKAFKHLANAYCKIPDGSKGILNLIADYEKSNMKKEDDYLLDWVIDGDYAKFIRDTAYRFITDKCPQVARDIFDNDKVKNPKAIKYVMKEMHHAGFDPRDMVALLYSIYTDNIRNPLKDDWERKYARAEWSKWPAILIPGINF